MLTYFYDIINFENKEEISYDNFKTKLVIQPGFDPKKSPFLDQLVLFFDEDDTDWVYEENGDGNVCVC